MSQQIKKKFLAPQVVSYFDDQIIELNNDLTSEENARSSEDAAIRAELAAADIASVNEAKSYADQKVAEAKTEIMGGIPESTLDTITEIAAAIVSDQTATGAILTQLGELESEKASRFELSAGVVEAKDYADSQIAPIAEIFEYQKFVTFEDNAQVFADSQPGVMDLNHRPGWFFENMEAGQKINWYFFDGVNQANISLGDFSAYAVMTFDSVSPVRHPILAVYTMPTGTNDVAPGFAHSRVVYSSMSPTPVAGKKYLVYFGQNPAIHPELPRIELALNPSLSVGEKLPTERVLTTSFGSDSGSAVNTVKFLVESLGINSPDFKAEAELRIKMVIPEVDLTDYYNKAEADAKIAEFLVPYATSENVIAGDDATLFAANENTEARVVVEQDARIAGDDATLASSQAYTDAALVPYALQSDYVSIEQSLQLEGRVEILENDSDIVEVESLGEAPAIGLVGKLYASKDSNKLYRWATSSGGSLSFDKVVGEGEEFATLQDALAAANDGENILVKAGTYLVSSTIAVNKQVKIVGEDKATVIFETAATTSAPVSMFSVSVSNAALAKMTIKHKKTSNTSVETAVVASGGGFPQTRIQNFIMEDCIIEYAEFGLTVRAESWCVRNTTFTYATGSVSNSCRAIGIYGNKGNSFIKDVFLKNDVLNGTASRPFYLTSTTGSNPNETTSGKLVIEGTTHVGPLAQFFNQDNQQSEGAGTFELQIKNNVINESNLFAAFYSAAANAGDMFSSVTLSGNSISNLHAIDGGKGLYGIAGTAAFRSSPLVVHASNNILGQEVYRAGWMAVDGSTIGKETAVPAFSVALDSSIPESGEAPQVSPSGSSSYVEVSGTDLSGIESEVAAIDSRLDALEAQVDGPSFANGSAIVGAELSFIDLDRVYLKLMSCAVGRMAVHEGEDFITSIVDGKTRITWVGSLLAPGGAEAIEEGDKIFFVGAY